MAKSPVDNLLASHPNLTHSTQVTVLSHVQREKVDWFFNTLMIAGVDVPFTYKRKQRYRSLNGQQVNLTYYPATQKVAGFEVEIMKVVRIRVS
ncbi:MAG: hypothetical protein HRU25_12635 [Psychrobium sp.]|nr:hypothetical protein [Psychrobium sp.]